MAVIHITEAEVLSNPSSILEKAQAGVEIYIEGGPAPLHLTKIAPGSYDKFRPIHTQPRLISEIIADLERHPSSATLDDKFGSDLEAVIRSHEDERPFDPWEAS